ncbi:type II secretion system minor pseudopilin GspK [bacterium]|nr:type II secretion system minor pseudopilin GspK [bacterium]
MTGRRKQQAGVALLTALFIAALASIAAVALVAKQNVAFHRTETLQRSQQAWFVARGAADWVKTLLETDAQDNDVDYFGEFWAQPVDYLPVDNGVLSGRVLDQSGKFNLNNMAAPDPDGTRSIEIFKRLIRNLDDLQGVDPDAIVSAILDWIDADAETRFPGGAEDGIYLSKSPAYRAANREFVSVTELRLVEGITPKLYAQLAPLVTALPEFSLININTADEKLLYALAENPSPSDIASFVEIRNEEPAEDPRQITEDALLGPGVDANGLGVQSYFFLLEGEANIGRGRVRLYSLLYRSTSGDVKVIAQSRDAF